VREKKGKEDEAFRHFCYYYAEQTAELCVSGILEKNCVTAAASFSKEILIV